MFQNKQDGNRPLVFRLFMYSISKERHFLNKLVRVTKQNKIRLFVLCFAVTILGPSEDSTM